jgi:hypothetical protein
MYIKPLREGFALPSSPGHHIIEKKKENIIAVHKYLRLAGRP